MDRLIFSGDIGSYIGLLVFGAFCFFYGLYEPYKRHKVVTGGKLYEASILNEEKKAIRRRGFKVGTLYRYTYGFTCDGVYLEKPSRFTKYFYAGSIDSAMIYYNPNVPDYVCGKDMSNKARAILPLAFGMGILLMTAVITVIQFIDMLSIPAFIQMLFGILPLVVFGILAAAMFKK